MSNFVKKAAVRTQEFVNDHKVGITIVVTATATVTACVAMTRMLNADYKETVDNFLDDKGLTEEFTALFEEL